jgi:hypothetical protein
MLAFVNKPKFPAEWYLHQSSAEDFGLATTVASTHSKQLSAADELAHVLRMFTPIFALFSLSLYTDSLKRTVLSFI